MRIEKQPTIMSTNANMAETIERLSKKMEETASLVSDVTEMGVQLKKQSENMDFVLAYIQREDEEEEEQRS